LINALEFNYNNESRLVLKEQYQPDAYIYSPDDKSIKNGNIIYTFLEPINLDQEYYLYLKYSSDKDFILSVNDSEYIMPASNDIVTSYIYCKEKSGIQSFSINLSSEHSDSNLLIESGVVSVTEYEGIRENSKAITFSENNVLLTFGAMAEESSIKLIFESKENPISENIHLKIDDENSYSITSRSGLNSFWIYGNVSMNPVEQITAVMNDAVLRKVLYNQTVIEDEALPVDLEEFISWDQSSWRQDDYEIFRWDLFQGILLLDTADYEIQSAFFKRLAFFTEKKNSVGELLSNDVLESLHGWNAHDYKAEDLARFFNEVEMLNFPLNDHERLLKRMLIKNGVLKESGERVRPLQGGIVSISRESTERLRWLFLTHECYHGLFFSSEEYVGDVYKIWNSLADEQKDFWRIFLGLYGYNINDEYLLINEFQAYSMQQNTSLANSYFRSKINWIISIRPNLKVKMDQLLAKYENSFEESALLVEQSAYSLTGIKAGDLVLKRKK